MNLNTALKYDYHSAVDMSYVDIVDYMSVSNKTPLEAKPSLDKNVIFQDYELDFTVKEKEIAWWIGRVVEIEEDFFTAKLEDLAGKRKHC